MHVVRCGAQTIVWAPAKVNLFLEVLGRRDDGYHEIETLMTAIGLYDTLYFDADLTGLIRFRASWAGGERGRRKLEHDEAPGATGGELPQGPANLVVRAAELLRERAAINAGAHMRLVKRIPMEAGLGGGSSDAAAALVAANIGWDLNWPRAKLAQLAAELGSDVPFFLGSGTAVCRGRGERVSALPGFGRLSLVVVRPPAGLNTAAVYARVSPAGEPVSVTSMLQAGYARGSVGLGRGLVNRLQLAASQLCPSIAQLAAHFQRLDLLGHQLSGSGSGYFGLCRHARQARRTAQLLRARRAGRVYCVASSGGWPRRP
jgi:4-diphosphocytidyl-2-C-methyl-D-erythritol kinase